MDGALWIVIAVVAVLAVLGVLMLVGRRTRNAKMHGKAERIREEIQQESVQVDRRSALATETEARARAAQAEAEAKAAEAQRLAERAQQHRSAATESREELEARLEHADAIDPKVKAADRSGTQEPPRAQEPPR